MRQNDMAAQSTAAERAREESRTRGQAFINAWKPAGWRLQAGAAGEALAKHRRGEERLREWCLYETTYAFDGGKLRVQEIMAAPAQVAPPPLVGASEVARSYPPTKQFEDRIAMMHKAAKALFDYAEARGRVQWLMQQGADAKAEVEAVPKLLEWLQDAPAEQFAAGLRCKAREVMEPAPVPGAPAAPTAEMQRAHPREVIRARAASQIKFEDIEQLFKIVEEEEE